MLKIAQLCSIILYSLIFIFHGLVLLKVIPYDIVWGGRLKSDAEMYQFEAVSILLNLLFLIIVLLRSNYISHKLKPLMLSIPLWLMAALFFLNSIGNLMAVNSLETKIFTPITILLTVFSVILALGKR